jgi:hypothetical protein
MMKMTGKEIVDAFCHYQGYGEWTLKEKELIQAIDDNLKNYYPASFVEWMFDETAFHGTSESFEEIYNRWIRTRTEEI